MAKLKKKSELPNTIVQCCQLITNRTPKPKKTLEIIIDTCSHGTEQLAAIDTLITRVEKASPRVYDSIRIIIPVQLATELKQKIFPDFLKSELALPFDYKKPEKPGHMHLRKFYHKHFDKIEVVETDISHAYKFKYAACALECLCGEGGGYARASILKESSMFLDTHSDIKIKKKDEKFSGLEMDAFIKKLSKAVAKQKESFEKARIKFEKREGFGGLDSEERTELLHAAEIKNVARAGKRFEKGLQPHERVFLQALYSSREVNHAVSSRNDFMDFRADKGERAIDWYLFNGREDSLSKGSKTHDPDTVTVIVSEDQGARESINALRHMSKNKVLFVGNDGLKTAVHCFESASIPTMNISRAPRTPASADALSPRQQNYYNCHPLNKKHPNPRHANILRGQRLHPPKTADEAAIHEGEWGRRLAELIDFGDWTRSNEGFKHASRLILALNSRAAIDAPREVGVGG